MLWKALNAVELQAISEFIDNVQLRAKGVALTEGIEGSFFKAFLHATNEIYRAKERACLGLTRSPISVA